MNIVALDTEMVEDLYGRNMLGRVSIVNRYKETIYDKYVKPTLQVRNYRTPYSGIRREHLVNAEDFQTVQNEVLRIINNAIVVGHSLHHDFEVLKITHPKHLIKDVSKYPGFHVNYRGIKALRHLAEQYLHRIIQKGTHDSVEDAIACMDLYMQFMR